MNLNKIDVGIKDLLIDLNFPIIESEPDEPVLFDLFSQIRNM